MKAKHVNESKNRKGKSFGEVKIMELVQKYLSFIPNPEYLDFDDRNDPNTTYDEDDIFKYWDYIEFDDPNLEDGCSMMIAIDRNDRTNTIGVLVYNDATAYDGDFVSEEFDIDLIDIKNFTKETYDKIIKQILNN